MIIKSVQTLSAAAVLLALCAPAMALNPQPLPPGRSAFREMLNPQPLPPGIRRAFPGSRWGFRAGRLGAYGRAPLLGYGLRAWPRCRSAQVGDPRKQPPMRACS